MKILINALSGIGDALMFTPALALLRKEFPEAKIDALTMLKGVKELYENLEEPDNVFYYDMLNKSKFSTAKYLSKLRNTYDVSVNVYPSNRKEYNLLHYFLKAKKRLGVNYIHNNFFNLGFLNNVTVKENNTSHCVETNVKLIQTLINKDEKEIPPLSFPLKQTDIDFASRYLSDNRIEKNDFVVGIHAGCSTLKNHINRRWQAEKFAELSKLLIERRNAKVLLFGGPDEKELKNKIENLVANNNFINVITENLRQTAAIIKRSDLFVTNDSGLMHIAAAMKRKTIVIIGPTNPYFIHPWQTEYRIASLNLDCAPCFFYSPKPLTCGRTDEQFKCMHDLSVEIVYKITEEFLDK